MKNRELIGQMTLEEKASLMSGENFWETKRIDRLGIPSFAFADGPNGVRSQAGQADHLGLHPGKPSTCYPTASAVANSWDEQLAEAVGISLGQEAAEQEVSVLLGPGLNIKRNPLCGRNFEYFSEDPVLSGKMAAAYVRGIQSQGISACVKHFAANNQELHRMSNDSVVDERALREIYLTGFEIAVREGKPLAVMSSYNRVNGSHASENGHLLQDILVEEWGFEGIVVTDWGGSHDRVNALSAGTHVEMPATKCNSDIEIVEAVRAGILSEALLDQRVDEYLNVLSKLKTFSKESEGTAKTAKEKAEDLAAHHDVARRAAEESVVLLKNEGNLLPLAKGTRVAVIGDFAKHPRYQGGGSSNVNPTRVDDTLSCIAGSPLEMVGYAQGFQRKGAPDKDLVQGALDLAKKVQVVLLYLGLDEMNEVEGLERSHMAISQNQVELLRALKDVNPNIVVVMSCGSAIEMPWIDGCKALLLGSLAGQAGAMAMLHVVTGKVCPGGRLSESYPLTYEDIPTSGYFPGREETTEYRESVFVGYRYYGKKGVPVRFPFGFGLSYTTFEYSDLEIDADGVSFTLTNTGTVAGAEVAQLYVSLEQSVVFRPRLELKGFAKAYLQPKESRRIMIPFDDRTFRYFNVRTNRFEIEKGSYGILVGASAEEILLEGTFGQEGTGASAPYVEGTLGSYEDAKIKAVSDQEFASLLGREIPRANWDKSSPLTRNDTISQLFYARSAVARLAFRILDRIRKKAEQNKQSNLNILYIYNMPFYALAKMAGGMINMRMVDSLLILVNGRFFKGLSQVIVEYFRMRSAQKRFRETLMRTGQAVKAGGAS